MRKSDLCCTGNIRLLLSVLVAMSMYVISGCGPKNYITPNYKEYTTGGIFADKYWSQFSGGTNVKLEGTFKGLSTAVLDGVEQLIFRMDVPGGIDSVDVYAQRGFATQLYGIKKGSNIVVYGKTMVITYKSRVDSGNLGAHLAVQLDKIEVK